MNLIELLAQSVERHGDKTCLSYAQDGQYKEISYNQFWHHIVHFARGLDELTVKPNSRVAILSENRPEWAISDFSTLLLQAVVVPIYPTLPSSQIGFILENAQVEVAIVENEEQRQKVLATQYPLRHVIVMDMYNHHTSPTADDEVQSESNRDEGFSEDEKLLPQTLGYRKVLQAGTDAFDETEPWLHYESIPEDQLATIVHTSGTSGIPKGVMLTHGNIASNVAASLEMLPVSESDIGLSYLPLSHVFERTVGHFATLSVGATIAYAESIEEIQNNLQQVRPTVLVTVPRLLEKVYGKIQEQISAKPIWIQRLLQRPIANGQTSGLTYRLVDTLLFRKIRSGLGNRMRMIVSGGAPLSEEIGRFYTMAGIPVYEGYGMTESAPVIAANPWGKAKLGTVGIPLSNVDIRLAEDGELLVKGPNVMQGYINAAEETRKVLDPDGWLHTGDIAQIVEGYVRIVDRKKNILVLATGKNVAPAPVENAIALAPHIGAAVLVGDRRKYVTVLLVPDFEAMEPFLKEHHITDGPESWVRDERVIALIQQEVNDAVQPFAEFERPKRAVLLPRDWTVDSGELTPTLKVRTKNILRNYAKEIDNMYAGKNYIPLAGSTDLPVVDDAPDATPMATDSSALEEETDAVQRPRRRRVPWPIRGAAALAILLAVGLASLLLHLPQKFNLNGMVQGIHKHNKDINQQNNQIIGKMKDIQQSSAATPVIASRLGQLNTGIGQNGQALQQLDTLSKEEQALSQNFKTLAGSMNGDMKSISASSLQQRNAILQMSGSTQHIDATAARLSALQKTISGKLASAASDSQTIAKEMP